MNDSKNHDQPTSDAPWKRGKGEDQTAHGEVYTPAPQTNPVVAALKGAGLYVKQISEGTHELTCPWSGEHGSDCTSAATYSEPNFDSPIGRFVCGGRHAERRTEGDLIAHLGIGPAEARAKPVIRSMAGETPRCADAAERELAADGAFFHANGPIVRIVHKPGQGLSSEIVHDQTLKAVLASTIDWEKKLRGGDWVRCDAPDAVVQMIRHNQDRRHLRFLAGLARQPFYGREDRLTMTPGYDEETGIYGAFETEDFDIGHPDRDAAEEALAYLKVILSEFPWASEHDQSAALSAMLTAACRASLSQAPAFNINAPRSGSGKSYLASLISLMAGPGHPYSMSYPTTSEEASKVMLTVLLEKPAVVLFDDTQDKMRSFGAINKALTSPTTTERLLGTNKTATARTNVLFLATGNNIEPEKDMRRRVVPIRLNPRKGNPALRRFERDAVGELRKNRAQAVSAAFKIIEAYRVYGQPTDAPPVGTFNEWSSTCRQPLLWLGEPDPAHGLIDQLTHDPDQQLFEQFLFAWWREFGQSSMTVRKVIDRAASSDSLMDAIAELTVMDGRVVNPNRLGWYLRHHKDQTVKGFTLEQGESSERLAWKVVSDGKDYADWAA